MIVIFFYKQNVCSLLGLTVTLVIKMWISCSAKRRPKIKNKTTKLITKIKKGNKRKKKEKRNEKKFKKRQWKS